eukprot:scaffold45210_cov63-Phaeocystis_antarctica.AAC.2
MPSTRTTPAVFSTSLSPSGFGSVTDTAGPQSLRTNLEGISSCIRTALGCTRPAARLGRPAARVRLAAWPTHSTTIPKRRSMA